MFNFGLWEVLLIAIVAILVIGPKELPVVMAHVGRIVKRLAYMRFAVTQQMDQFVRDAGLEDVKNSVNFEAPLSGKASDDDEVLPPEAAHKAALEAFVIDDDDESSDLETKDKPSKDVPNDG